jgi:transposase
MKDGNNLMLPRHSNTEKLLIRSRTIRLPHEPDLKNTSLPVARRLVWIFLQPEDKLTPDETKLRNHLSNNKILAQALKLGEEFREMIQAREAHGFADWLKSCESSKIPELRNLALGMRKDFSAIQNALHLPWSNGQTEGQINRLKLLKRQMYGRAKFDLLRLRCLQPP